MRSYEFNEDSARQAGASNFIDSTGKYKGSFTLAKELISKKGTEGIEFSFEADDGRVANYLQLWTYNAKGEPLYGLKVLNAILTCARLKTLTGKEAQLKGKDGMENVITFPSLYERKIGLLLQREEYRKSDGTAGYKFNIYAPFHPDTELMASELLDKKTAPELLAKVLSGLADKPMSATQPRTSQTAAASENPADDW